MAMADREQRLSSDYVRRNWRELLDSAECDRTRALIYRDGVLVAGLVGAGRWAAIARQVKTKNEPAHQAGTTDNVPADKARRNWTTLMDDAGRGFAFTVTRRGRPVAVLVPGAQAADSATGASRL